MCSPQSPRPLLPGTECHRGIFDIPNPLHGYAHQPSITCDPVGGRLWTASDGTYRTVFCEGDSGLIAFDTFYSPGAAVAYKKALNRVFPEKPIHTVVYSHDHLDHTGFAADLAPEAEVVAHEECAKVIEARRSDGQTVPTTVFGDDGWSGEIDGVELDLRYPGPTHGNGNLAAFFPEQEALFMVDTVAAGVGYAFYPDWHVGGYSRTMRNLLEGASEWQTLIPGHFWHLDRAAALGSLDFFDAMLDTAAEALVAGVDPDSFGACERYAAEHLADRFGQLFRFREYGGMNLMRMMAHLRQGGWGLEDSRPDLEGDDGAPGSSRAVALAPRLGGPELEVAELAPGVEVAAAGDRRALILTDPERPACIGTLGTPAAARALGARARAGGGGDPILVLATDHLDQSGFASELEPAQVIAQELTLRALDGKLGATAMPEISPVRDGGEEVELAGAPAQLLYPGPTVGTGTLAVYLPETSVLYVVGPRPDARYGLFGDFHFAGATTRWRQLLDLEPEIVVFARGGVGDAAQLRRACDYIDALSVTVQRAFGDGIAIWGLNAMEDYSREQMVGDFGDLGGFDEHLGIGAIRVVHHYLMGGWGLEDGFVEAAK